MRPGALVLHWGERVGMKEAHQSKYVVPLETRARGTDITSLLDSDLVLDLSAELQSALNMPCSRGLLKQNKQTTKAYRFFLDGTG